MQRGPHKFLELYALSHRRNSDCSEQMIARRMREHPGGPGTLDERLLIVVEVIDDMINELRWECRRESRRLLVVVLLLM